MLLMQHPQKMIEIEEDEPIWSANIKRSIVSLFQIEGSSEAGAFVSNEFGIYGLCPTEYYVVNSSDSLYISKIYDMNSCTVPGGIFQIRSNIPINVCEMENKISHAVHSRTADYKLKKTKLREYQLESIKAESKSNVQAFESYYPQFIFTNILIDRVQEEEINDENRMQFDSAKKTILSDFLYVTSVEPTGGRASKTTDQIVETVAKLLKELAEHLEQKELNFDEPYLEIVSEIIRLVETIDLDGLMKLYDILDIGTSYIQETSKNIFLEILPRVGTSSSILLTKHLVTKMLVKPTTAIQLLTALPFFISELSYDLIKECEEFLHVGHTPDVKHSAVLCYSTMIYKAYVARALTSDQFEKYVKMIFDLFLSEFIT
jgi:Lipoprotein amino terminal region